MMTPIAQQRVARSQAAATGRRFALLGMAIGLAQVVTATTTSLQRQGALITTQHELQAIAQAVFATSSNYNIGYPEPELIVTPLRVGVLGCIIGGILNWVVVYLAARSAGRAQRDRSAGRQAGNTTALLSWVAWMAWSVLGVVLGGNDGLLLTRDPYNSTSMPMQTLLIASIVVGRAVIFGGLWVLVALIFSTSGARSGARIRSGK